MPENGSNQGKKPPPPKGPDAGTPSGTAASDASLERFAKAFETSARRWEMVVYPSLFAFIILAAYGFFLIYSLTKDMHTLAVSIDPRMQPHMETMANNVAELSVNIASMTERIHEMADNVKSMDSTVGKMNSTMEVMKTDMTDMSTKMNTLEPMLVNMASMTQAMHAMTATTGVMSRDVGVATYQFARPMSFMNSFFPW